MRIGIFGGSFDPVHNGHVALARACQAEAALDEVWFTPAAIQPLKRRGPHAADCQRVEMLRLVIDGQPAWRVCTLELDRGGFSYTVDTLRQIHELRPDAELFCLLGADAVRDVPNWREPDAICRLATPLVVRRAGQAELILSVLSGLCPAEHRPKLVDMPAINVSSSEIRRRIAAGEAIDDLVPRSVAAYIYAQHLYR